MDKNHALFTLDNVKLHLFISIGHIMLLTLLSYKQLWWQKISSVGCFAVAAYTWHKIKNVWLLGNCHLASRAAVTVQTCGLRKSRIVHIAYSVLVFLWPVLQQNIFWNNSYLQVAVTTFKSATWGWSFLLSRATKVNEVKIYPPLLMFMKRPQNKFHTHIMSESQVIRSIKVKIYHSVKIYR